MQIYGMTVSKGDGPVYSKIDQLTSYNQYILPEAVDRCKVGIGICEHQEICFTKYQN